ncbi:MAG: hypothetical protein C0510_03545 [Erythrobacter sp.]|nr:hypothetical protein [Erythrobacter sp.]
MATLILGAIGTAVAGPIGGALASLVGNQVDSRLFSPGSKREGPRVKDLAFSTSSYGQPIGRQFGHMRVPGAIIWSTDLIESREASGGGKGKPKVTTFSYSASFAVAISSRPIHAVGRIWADGRLLRGSAGDLKSAGTLRIHHGHGDQAPDPLIAAAEGAQSPAFRDCAYVVFEDLQLAEFGNRIPALSFEVLADAQPLVTLGQIAPCASTRPELDSLPHMLGFTDEGGPLLDSLEAISRAYPLTCITGGTAVEIDLTAQTAGQLPSLSEPLATSRDDSPAGTGREQFRRAASTGPTPVAMRYYDRDRDYQPGVQRAIGLPATGRELMLDMPAAMSSGGARSIANAKAQKSRWQGEAINWTIAQIDPGLGPGIRVRVPGIAGIWTIEVWEWNDQGIELTLTRLPPLIADSAISDPGRINAPIDLPAVPTVLKAVELPWDGTGPAGAPSFLAAVSAGAGNWSGAALFAEQAGGLVLLDTFATRRSVFGTLTVPLPASSSTLFEPTAELHMELVGDDLAIGSTTIAGLSAGANRLLVGREVIQFLTAEQTGPRGWRLSGLLRGRGGTEPAAGLGHVAGTDAILVDETLISLDPALFAETGTTRLAAIGLADDAPVFASLDADGVSRLPPPPVYARRAIAPNGDWELCWSRRARGHWRWPDFVETPLIEEQEAYQVGVGNIEQPLASWLVQSPRLVLEANIIASYTQSASQPPVWVRQLGTYGPSHPTLIAQIP